MENYILQIIQRFLDYKEVEKLTDKNAYKYFENNYHSSDFCYLSEIWEREIKDKGVLEAIKGLQTEEQHSSLVELLEYYENTYNYVLTQKPQGDRIEYEESFGYIKYSFESEYHSQYGDTSNGTCTVPIVNGIYLQFYFHV